MHRHRELCGTDFDGRPTDGIDDVIHDALESPRHTGPASPASSP
ncbi:hypothetical protein EES42_20015 [Streptomyces sp. ADI95-17]|nr:hypothetical protein EES42_20015 [Streptomyces sp. ADI95-17]